MGLKLITAPAGSVITLDEFKNAVGIFNTARDSWAASCLASAVSEAEKQTGRQLLTAEYELTLPWLVQTVEIRRCPVKSIDAITYYDADNQEQSIDPEDTGLVTYDLNVEPAVLRFKESFTTYDRADAITIAFTAGYGAASDVPDDLKAGIILLAGKLFENPVDSVEQLPKASTNLFRNFRYYGRIRD